MAELFLRTLDLQRLAELGDRCIPDPCEFEAKKAQLFKRV